MCSNASNNSRPQMQGLSGARNRRPGQSENKESSRAGWLVALGGLAAGIGIAAYIYFNSDDDEPQVRVAHENKHAPNVQQLRQAVSERFRTRSLTNEECAICTEPLQEQRREELCVLTCGHIFHNTCYKKWEKSQEKEGTCPTCPVCRMRDPTNVTGQNPHSCCK